MFARAFKVLLSVFIYLSWWHVPMRLSICYYIYISYFIIIFPFNLLENKSCVVWMCVVLVATSISNVIKIQFEYLEAMRRTYNFLPAIEWVQSHRILQPVPRLNKHLISNSNKFVPQPKLEIPSKSLSLLIENICKERRK